MRRLELTNLIISPRLKWNINLLVKKAFLIFSWGVKLQQWRQMESQSPVFCKKNAHKNFSNFTGKNLCWSLFLIKVACQGLQKKSCTCFPENFVKFLRTAIFRNICKSKSSRKIKTYLLPIPFIVNHNVGKIWIIVNYFFPRL